MTTEAIVPVVRVLVVDDDARFPDYLRVMLRDSSIAFEIDVAATARDALRELAQSKHHVCLLDYRLGTEDGLDVLRRAQARGVRTPIVLLTGEGSESLEFMALEGGATDYLDKSELDPRRLERTMCRAIARQRAEAALHQRETRLAEAEGRALVMATRVSLDGYWLKVPPRFCELLGYTEEELLSMRFHDVTHPDDLDRDLRERHRLLEGGTKSIELEKRYVRKDGVVVWIYLNCSLIAGEDGTPLCYLAYVRDIGDHKRAEAALAASEQRYRSMVRNAPYGIFEATSDGRFLAVNPALVAMLGYQSEQDLLPLGPAAVYVNPGEGTRALHQIGISGPLRGVETRWVRRDGSIILVRITAHLTAEREGVVNGVVEDVTERKRLEDQLRQAQKMEAVGQLAGGIAHDFNNLLTAILGYTDLLKERCQDAPDVQSDLDEIKHAGASAASLTEQLLAFSRKQVLKPEVLSVNAVIESMQKLLPRVLGEDIQLVTTLAPDAPRIEADPVQLQQVILNLAVNARDAMPLGGRLAIETASFRSGHAVLPTTPVLPGRYVVITVSDNGAGMDAATHSRIFEPFFTTKAPGKGTGLGLATVYGIIKQTGGEVFCETVAGQGTRFSIFLPATDRIAKRTTGMIPAIGAGSETVLLVEDQVAVRRLTRRILEAHGYAVLDTGDAHAALRMAAESRFDVLLSDVVMPQMSGPELARQVRAYAPHARVLFMSGFAGHSALAELGGALLLDKPFAPATLVSRLREVLHG